jgi:hypothetical protein
MAMDEWALSAMTVQLVLPWLGFPTTTQSSQLFTTHLYKTFTSGRVSKPLIRLPIVERHMMIACSKGKDLIYDPNSS